MLSSPNVRHFFESLKLDRPRTPRQLEILLEDVRRGFTESEELRKESRGNGGRLTKKYFEEIYPLALLVRHLFADRSDVICEPNFDDTKSFDAAITIGSPLHDDVTKFFVEFAYAKDGYDEDLRMQVLNSEGHVSLTAPLSVVGTKKTGRHVTIGEDAAELRDQRLKTILGLILDRLERKAGPKYSSVDMLAVVFDDLLGFRKPEELAKLRSSIESSPSLSRLKFRTVVLLGSSGNVFLEFRLAGLRGPAR